MSVAGDGCGQHDATLFICHLLQRAPHLLSVTCYKESIEAVEANLTYPACMNEKQWQGAATSDDLRQQQRMRHPVRVCHIQSQRADAGLVGAGHVDRRAAA